MFLKFSFDQNYNDFYTFFFYLFLFLYAFFTYCILINRTPFGTSAQHTKGFILYKYYYFFYLFFILILFVPMKNIYKLCTLCVTEEKKWEWGHVKTKCFNPSIMKGKSFLNKVSLLSFSRAWRPIWEKEMKIWIKMLF